MLEEYDIEILEAEQEMHLNQLVHLEGESRAKAVIESNGVKLILKAAFRDDSLLNEDVEMANQSKLADLCVAYNTKLNNPQFTLATQLVYWVSYISPADLVHRYSNLLNEYNVGEKMVVSYCPYIEGLRYSEIPVDKKNIVMNSMNGFRYFAGQNGIIPYDFALDQLHYQISDIGCIKAYVIDYEDWDFN